MNKMSKSAKKRLRKRNKKEKKQKEQNNIIKCVTCDNTVNCPCINENHISPKYRSCACNDTYPKSKLNPDGVLIHICSSECNN